MKIPNTWILIFSALLLLSGCGLLTYYPLTNPPPQSREGIHQAVSRDILKVQARKTASEKLCDGDGCITVALTPPAGTKVAPKKVSRCNDFWTYRQQGWTTDQSHYNNDYAFIESCNVLKFVEDAKPSRTSRFILPLMKGYDIQEIEPGFVDFLAHGQDSLGQKTDRDFHCRKTECDSAWGTVALKNGGLIVINGERHTSYFVGGRGDMDGDGWEDLLINYSSYAFRSAELGPDRISGHFCLSWRGEDKVATAWDCVNDMYLPHLAQVQ